MARSKQENLSDEALELVAGRFRVLGEVARLRILRALQQGERNVSELVQATTMTQANVSRHLQTLSEAGIVSRRKVGLQVFYQIADPGIYALCDQVCNSLQEKLDRQRRLFGVKS